MAAIFLDTNIFLYAVGAEPALRDASQKILKRVAEGDLVATTNSEVLQETSSSLRGHVLEEQLHLDPPEDRV